MSKDAPGSCVTSTMSSSLFSSAPPSPPHSSPPTLSSDSITPIIEKRDPIRSFVKPFLKRGSTHALDSIKDHFKIGIYKPSHHHSSSPSLHPSSRHHHRSSVSSAHLDPATPHPPPSSTPSRVGCSTTLQAPKPKPSLISNSQPTPASETRPEASQYLPSESAHHNHRHGKTQTLQKLSRAGHSAVLKLQAISSLSLKDLPSSSPQPSAPPNLSSPGTAPETTHEPDPSSSTGSDLHSNQGDHPPQSSGPCITSLSPHPNLTAPSSIRNSNSFVSMTSSIHSLLTQPALVTLAQLAPAQLLSGVHSSCFGSFDAFRGFDEFELAQQSSDPSYPRSSCDPSHPHSQTGLANNDQASTLKPPARRLPTTIEQLSASSIALPITSISSIWRLLNCIEWINLKESQYFDDPQSKIRQSSCFNHSPVPSRLSTQERFDPEIHDPAQALGSFDLANTLQHVGDILSAISSESDVEIVFYHIFYPPRSQVVELALLNSACEADQLPDHHRVSFSSESPTGPGTTEHLRNEPLPETPNLFLGAGADGEGGLREISVKADEKGLIIGLTCLLRQILYRAKRSSTIEVGLHLTPLHSEPISSSLLNQGAVDPSVEEVPDGRRGDSTLPKGSVCTGWKCVFEVSLMAPLLPKPKPNPSNTKPPTASCSNTEPISTTNLPNPDPPAPDQRASIGAQLRASATLARLRMSSNLTSELPLCPEESLSKIIFERLLGMKLSTGRLTSSGHSWKVTGIFEKGIDRESDELSSHTRKPQPSPIPPQASVAATGSLAPSREPTADELTKFAESVLKGKKAVFFAAEQSIFAKHITTYLTSWNIDVSHMPYECSHVEQSQGSDSQAHTSSLKAGIGGPERPSKNSSSRSNTNTSVPVDSTASHASHRSIRSNNFIIIDDDIATLKVQLAKLKALPSSSLHLSASVIPTAHQPSQRPSMSRRVPSFTQTDSSEVTPKVVHTSVIHFTSISNFRKVQEIIRTRVIGTQWASIPDVLVIPKPIGPRRILTALHTAVSRPLTEHQFVPIATSPSSPGTPYYLGSTPQPLVASQLGKTSPTNYLGVTDFDTAVNNHLKNDSNHSHALSAENSGAPRPTSVPTSTPPGLRTPGTAPGTPGFPSPALLSNEALEYFSKAATENGGSSSTGVVLQSPDGRPQAMFFHHSGSSNRLRSDMLSQSNHGHLQSSLSGGPITRSSSGNLKPEARRTLSRSMAREMTSACTEQAHPMTLAQHVMSGIEGIARTQSPSLTSNAGSNDLERSETSTSQSTREPLHQSIRMSNLTHSSVLGDPPDSVFPHAMALAQYEAIPLRTPIVSSPDGLYSAIQLSQNSISPTHSFILTPTTQNDHPTAPVTPSGSLNGLNTLTGEQQQSSLNPRPLPMLRMPSIPASLPTSISVTLPSPRRLPVSQSSPGNDTGSSSSRPSSSPPLTASHIGEELNGKLNPCGTPGVNEPLSSKMPRSTSAFITASKRRASMGDPMLANRFGRRRVSRKPTTALVPPINVLIVEDNRINQTILTTFMRKKSVKYDVAMNGQEAVDKWRTGSFHLVLMDLQLPVKDGIEATKEIREAERAVNINAFANTPPAIGGNTPPLLVAPNKTRITPHNVSVIIVALTASSLDVDREVALAAGCNDFLTKPVSLAWLEKKLLEWGSMAWLSGFSRSTLPSNSLNRSLPISGSNMMSVPTCYSVGGTKPLSFTSTFAQRKAKEVAEHLHLRSDKAHAAQTRLQQNHSNNRSSDHLGSDQSGTEEGPGSSQTDQVSSSKTDDDQSVSDSSDAPSRVLVEPPLQSDLAELSNPCERAPSIIKVGNYPVISLQIPTPERFDSFPSIHSTSSSTPGPEVESISLSEERGADNLHQATLIIDEGGVGQTSDSIQDVSACSSPEQTPSTITIGHHCDELIGETKSSGSR